MSIGGAGGANLGSARGEIILDISQLTRAVGQAQQHLRELDKSTVGWGKGLSDIASTSAVIGGGIAVGVGLAIRSFASFDQQLAGVAASLGGVGNASGITEQQFAALTDTALRIGKDTAFSANEAASAMDVLARAGVSANDIINGVADASVNLAAAIGEDIPQSAEAIASALAIFGLEAADAADVTDTLTAALNASQTDLTDFSAGMRNLGPALKGVGGTFQDAAAAIAYFTKFGLKGADVGVSLARAMDMLAKPTDEASALMQELGIAAFDAQGNFVGWPALMDQFNRALAGASDQERVFALRTIAGAEAADVLNIAVQNGGDGLRDMTENLTPMGQAADQAAQRMDSLAGTLEELKGSLEVAAIAAGQALAPAVESLAGIIEGLANGFSALPGPVQETATQAIAAAGAFALITGAGAKMVSFAIDTVAAWRNMARVIRESATAMRVLSIAFSPAGLAIAGISAVTLVAIQRHREHRQAVRDLEQAYRDLGTSINNLKLAGKADIAQLGADLLVNLQRTEEALQTRRRQLEELAQQQEAFASSLGFSTAAGLAAADSAQKYRRELAELGDVEKVIAEASRSMGAALETPGVNAEKMAKSFNFLIDQLRLGNIDIETFQAGVRGITENTGDWLLATEEQTDATEDLTDAQQQSAQATEEQVKAQERFNEQVDEFVGSTLDAIKGIEDQTDAIDGMQAGFGKAGDSINDVLLKMDDLGEIDLSDSEREAIELTEALNATERAITRTESAIENNADDMSMWQGRIQLVDETIGTAEDGYAALNEMVANGSLTQEEANEILEAAIWLRERSVGGLEDERAEQAKQLPILADYVRAHDDAAGATEDMTEAQKGFIAAMQTGTAQTYLQTLQVLLYMAALGLIPPEKVTDFIFNSGEADPLIKAINEDLGLIPPDVTTDVKVEDNASSALDDIGSDLGTLDGTNATVSVTLDAADIDGTNATAGLTSDTVVIPTALGAPDTSAVDDVGGTIGPVEIETVLVPPAAADGTAITSPEALEQTITTKVVVDDASAKQAITDLNASLDTLDARNVTVDIEADTDAIDLSGLNTSLDTAEQKVSDLTTALDGLPETVSTGYAFSEGETAGKTEKISKLLDEWPETVGTGYSFSEGESVGKTQEISDLLDEWPETVNTAFSFDQGSTETDIADSVGQVQALATASVTAAARINNLQAAISRAMGESAATVQRSTAGMVGDLSAFAVQSGVAGSSAGARFRDGIAAGVAAAASIASQGAARVLAALQVSGSAEAAGYGVGVSFGQGLAAGISSQTGVIAGAAAAAAAAAYAAAAAQLQVRSPSKRGEFLGRMFDRGIADGIADGFSEIAKQAKVAAERTSKAFESNIGKLALQGFSGGDPTWMYRGTRNLDGTFNQPALAASIAPSAMGGGNTYIDQRSFAVLHSDEFNDLLSKAERGASAAVFVDGIPFSHQTVFGRAGGGW